MGWKRLLSLVRYLLGKNELMSSSDFETYCCCCRGLCGDYGEMGKESGEGV
jgi:hypothetical protein